MDSEMLDILRGVLRTLEGRAKHFVSCEIVFDDFQYFWDGRDMQIDISHAPKEVNPPAK